MAAVLIWIALSLSFGLMLLIFHKPRQHTLRKHADRGGFPIFHNGANTQ